jgi:hypothetical protein
MFPVVVFLPIVRTVASIPKQTAAPGADLELCMHEEVVQQGEKLHIPIHGI